MPGALGALRAQRTPESLSEGPNLSATWDYGGFGPKFYRIEIAQFIGAIAHHEFETRSGGAREQRKPGAYFIALQQAGNYLNARLSGCPLTELQHIVAEEMAANRTQLDALSSSVVEAGLATWTGDGRGARRIVRG